jgi:hypothetical protein
MCSLEKVFTQQMLEDGVTDPRDSDIRYTCRICGTATDFPGRKALKRHIERIHEFTNSLKEPNGTISSSDARLCYNCKQPGHESKNCKVVDGRCFKCNQMGHIARSCPNVADNPRSSSTRSSSRHPSIENKILRESSKETMKLKSYEDVIDIDTETNVFLPYHCFYCAEEFRTSSVRQRHISTQHDAKLFSCEINCTSYTTNFRRAMLYHLDEVHYYYHDEGRSNRTEFLKLYSMPPTDARQVSCRLCWPLKTSKPNEEEEYEETMVGKWMAQGMEALLSQLQKHIHQYHSSESSNVSIAEKANSSFPLKKWFKLECRLCNEAFSGSQCLDDWKSHTLKVHDPVDSLVPIDCLSSDDPEG